MNRDFQDTANLWLQFARKAEDACDKHQKHLQKTKQRFNIFKALRVDGYEVPTSNFICYLLDPHEEHDCRDLFLQCFLQTLILIPPLAKNNQTCALDRLQVFERESCQDVLTEVFTDQGRRIDIVARFESAILAIENKIGAGDQNDQLLDYSSYLQTQSKQVLLLYLTPHGHGSESKSDGGCDYHRISYRDHILHWLGLCITKSSEYPRVKESIEQFRDMIQTVVNPAYPNPEMKLLTDFVRQNPIILKQRDMLSEAIRTAQMEIIQDFYQHLNRRLKEASCDRLEKSGGQLVRTPLDLNYHVITGSKIDNELSSYQLILEQDNDPPSLALGIRAPFAEPATTQPEHTDKLRRLGAFLKESHPNFHHDFGEWWPAGWVVLEKDPFTPEKCADSLLMDKMVELVTEKIICYIDVVEKWLEKTSS